MDGRLRMGEAEVSKEEEEWRADCAARMEALERHHRQETPLISVLLYLQRDLETDALADDVQLLVLSVSEDTPEKMRAVKDNFRTRVLATSIAGDAHKAFSSFEGWARPERGSARDAVETLFLCAQHRDFGTKTWTARIENNAQKRVSHWQVVGSAAGLFVNMVAEHAPNDSARRAARSALCALRTLSELERPK